MSDDDDGDEDEEEEEEEEEEEDNENHPDDVRGWLGKSENEYYQKKSLEALFQVTKSELKRMKCSINDQDEDVDTETKTIIAGHRCPFCGLNCGKPSVLKKHIRAHTNERPYPCLPCGIAFKTKSNLYKHCKSRAHQQLAASASTTIEKNKTDSNLNLIERRSNGDVIVEETVVVDNEDTDDSLDSYKNSPLRTTHTPVTIKSNEPSTSSSSVITSIIYKPKFHSVSHVTPSKSTEVRLPAPTLNSSLSCHSVIEVEKKQSGVNDNLAGDVDQHQNQPKRSLAKRRDETFRLCLEIPQAKSTSVHQIGLPSTPSSSSHNSDGFTETAFIAASIKSPMASPDFVQQHISKLISQNAAIVDKSDAQLWPAQRCVQRNRTTSVVKCLSPTADDQVDVVTDKAINVSGKTNPQNPEGSIIKDLLLKARAIGGVVQSSSSSSSLSSTSSSSCVRLSGGSISVVPREQLQIDESSGQYACDLCQQACFRSAENLEVHQAHYCRRHRVSSDHRTPLPCLTEEDQSSLRQRLLNQTSTASQSITNKPRGRPKGSKNRPKSESHQNSSYLIGKGSRVHSKSLCEYSVSDPTDVQNADEIRHTDRFRRNSVSGEQPASIKDILTSHRSHQSPDDSKLDSASISDGSILKKHLLLGGDKSPPPPKKRKIDIWNSDSIKSPQNDSALSISPTATNMASSNSTVIVTSNSSGSRTTSCLKSLEHLSRHPMTRPTLSKVCLFGGEVQVCDDFRRETSKAIIVGVDKLNSTHVKRDLVHDRNQDNETTSSVVATIAKPVHNSGGTVLQMCDKFGNSSRTQVSIASVGRPLMATGRSDNLSGAIVLTPRTSSSTSSQALGMAINISRLNLETCKPMICTADESKSNDDYVMLSEETLKKMERIRRSEVPSIAVHSPKSPPSSPLMENQQDQPVQKQTQTLQRPTSLLLTANVETIGDFGQHCSMVGTTLVSPETPRPEKKYGQCYLNGQYYTYLELKHSTRVYYCCIGRPQPMYVPQATDPKLSMYSVWQTVPQKPDSIGPVEAFGLYNSRVHYPYTIANSEETSLQTTHSSYWKFRLQNEEAGRLECDVDDSIDWEQDEQKRASPCRQEHDQVNHSEHRLCDNTVSSVVIDQQATKQLNRPSNNVIQSSSGGVIVNAGEAFLSGPMAVSQPNHRVRIFEGGFKSNESYTYVRGRGRGKYVCEDCGIRCKKPSMLKKHVRTHTDLRPYACNHCSFSFKTKGNLTKHMKSKAHHKKCTEMGIIPVPVSIDDVQIDEEALARQRRIEHQRRQFANDDDDSDMDDEDDEEEEEEEENGDDDEYECDDYMITTMQSSYEDDDESLEEGQFDDAERAEVLPVRCRIGTELDYFPIKSPPSEQESIARSLLDLGRPEVILSQSQFQSTNESNDSDRVNVLNNVEQRDEEERLSVDQPMDLSMPHSNRIPFNEDQIYDGGSIVEATNYMTRGLLQSYLLCDKRELEQRHDIDENAFQVHGRFDESSSRPSQRERYTIDAEDKVTCSSSTPYGYGCSPVATSMASSSSSSTTSHRLVDNRVASEVTGQSPTCSGAGMRRASSTYIQRSMDQGEGKCVCNICNKMFTRPSQLRLHVNIHYFERPFRCESCAISFRTKGHLQKHKRSLSHYNKVNMNLAFGTPTTDNPRPFKCGDCKIAFRIHGHLAKHLRSKMHIMKLECLGKLPFGTYAEIERSGASLNEIDTTDCENSLESLQTMAMRLVDKEQVPNAAIVPTSAVAAAAAAAPPPIAPAPPTSVGVASASATSGAGNCSGSGNGNANVRQFWQRERTISGGSIGDDQSDGVPYVESPSESTFGHQFHGHSGTNSRLYVMSGNRGDRDSPDSSEVVGGSVNTSWNADHKRVSGGSGAREVGISNSNSSSTSVKHEIGDRGSTTAVSSSPRRTGGASVKVVVMVERDLHGDEDDSPGDYVQSTSRNYYSNSGNVGGVLGGGTNQDGHGMLTDATYAIEDISADEDDELDALNSSSGLLAKDNCTSTMGHQPYGRRVVCQPQRVVSNCYDSTTTEVFVCECNICGELCPNSHTLKQHILVHSRLRPFVCEWCDAGFTTAHLLNTHHHQVHDRQNDQDNEELTCVRCSQSFIGSVEMKCHLLECMHSSDSSSGMKPSKLFGNPVMKPRELNTDHYGHDPT